MKREYTVAGWLFCVLFLTPCIQAEVVTIEATIKAVDAKERSITVTKTSKTKSKDIELEVGKKAKIRVGGEEAGLEAVKVGQKASVSYETELEVITKIEVVGDGTEANGKKTESDEEATEKDDEEAPIGTWVESRPDTPVGDRIRTFKKDGTFIIYTPKSKQKTIGTWRRDGSRVYFKTPPLPDAKEKAAEERWFALVTSDDQKMKVRMMGEREYIWRKTGAPADDGDDDATAKDMKVLQGEWKCIVGEENGKAQDKSKVKKENRRLTIKGNSLTMERVGASWVGKFEIDASNRHFDWVGKGSDGNLTEWIGIYELDGDNLKLCFIFQKDEKAKRPTKFKSFPPAEPGLAHAYYTFKRAND